MAITPSEATMLASLLPDELRCDNARERLLCVVAILRSLTDADHHLSNADMRLILQERFGAHATPSENTLAADVRAIMQSGYPDMRLHITTKGYWCERTELSPNKVRMLLNAVQASRFLTIEQSAELQEDLFELVSRHQEDLLAGEVHVDQRVRRSYQQVFAFIDTITRALHQGRKVEFLYSYSDFSGRPHALDGDDGSPLRVETPIALYFSENNYYLETYTTTPWRHGIELLLSRVDRMLDVSVSEQKADDSQTVRDLRRSARTRMAESFDMISGPQRLIFLRVRSDATNLLYDRFGFGLQFSQREGTPGSPSSTALTLLRLPQCFTFFRWLAPVSPRILMCEPPAELVIRSGPWAKDLRGISRDELMEDYQEMVQAFVAFLDRARTPYAAALQHIEQT